MVAGITRRNVIACPPPSDNYGGMDILSSLRMPSGISVATILDPENAADFVGKLYAATDARLQEIDGKIRQDAYGKIRKADGEMRGIKRKQVR